jgi:hypothetical protein
MNAFGAIRAALGLLLAVLVAGCNNRPSSGAVSGSVSYDGKPLDNGSITFYPVDGSSPTAGGFIKNGKYTVLKVPAGMSKVTISGSKVVGQKKLYDTPNSPIAPITEDPLPPKYKDSSKTELTFDVKPGNNEKNWDLPK